MSERYSFTVWTWVSGSSEWSLALASNDSAKAAQTTRALYFYGYGGGGQWVREFGAYVFSLPFRLELVYAGRVYSYGDVPDATAAYIVGGALRRLIPGSSTRTRDKRTGVAVDLASLMNPSGYV
jgi:uncharacterized membrane protein YedE/YeeE